MSSALEVKIEYKDGSNDWIELVSEDGVRISACGKYLVVDSLYTYIIELEKVDNWQARKYNPNTTHMTIDEYNNTFGGNL